MRFFTIAAAIIALSLTSCGDPAPVDQGPPEPIPSGQLGPDVTPLRYRLDLRIVANESRFGGKVEIDVELAKPKSAIYLHARDLDVMTVTARPETGGAAKGQFLRVTETGVAKLTFDRVLPKGKATLTIHYDGRLGDKPDTLWVAEEAGLFYAATQFQPMGARKAFPSFDEPRFKTPFEIALTVRASDVAVSNAAMVKEERAPGGLKRVIFAPTAKLPTYLVAFAAGPYDVVEFEPIAASAIRPDPIPLRGLTVKGKGMRIAYALGHTAPMVKYLEDYFGVPYPYGKLDIIAPPNFAAGGMENAGLIVYAERGILLDDSASAAQRARFFDLHAHELAHQWFGDLVTPKWWDDIWLNESFATWMAAKTAAAVKPGNGYERASTRGALRVMDTDSLDTARAIRQPIKSDDDIYNAFDGLTYQKGAAVLAMFEGFVSEEAFREGVRVHMKKFAHGVATAKDFLESLAEGTQRPEITAAFETFLMQPGVPFLRTQTACEGKIGKSQWTQGAYAPLGATAPPRTWRIPVCLRDLNTGKPADCALVSAPAVEAAFMDVCPNPALQMNAGGRGYYRFDVGQDGWAALLAKADKMPPAEQLTLADSMRAAFMAGSLDAKTYWAGLNTLALAEAPDTATAVAQHFAELRDILVPAASIPAFEAKLRALYGAIIRNGDVAMPTGETGPQHERRVAILNAMVRTARDPAALKAMRTRGDLLLNGQAGAVVPDTLPLALWSVAHGDGVPGLKRIMAAVIASSDSEFRGQALDAMAGARGRDAMEAIGGWLVGDGLRTRERVNLLRALFDDPDMRNEAWRWLRRSAPQLMERLTPSGRTNLIRVTEKFCDAAVRADVESFFKPRIAKMPGAPRALANALERVNRCISLKMAKTDEVADVIGGAPAKGRKRRR